MADALTEKYFPELWLRRKQQLNSQPNPVIECGSPQIYVQTQTVKMYKGVVAGENDEGETVLESEHSIVIPARYLCVQCLTPFSSFSDFKKHFKSDD